MPVTVLDSENRPHQFLTVDEVQGNPELAANEAQRQIRFAITKYNSPDTTRILKEIEAEQGSPVSAAQEIRIRQHFANELPAVQLSFPQSQQVPGQPLRVDVTIGTFAVDSAWPLTTGTTAPSPTPQVSTSEPVDPIPSQPNNDENIVTPTTPVPATPTVPVQPNTEQNSGGQLPSDSNIQLDEDGNAVMVDPSVSGQSQDSGQAASSAGANGNATNTEPSEAGASGTGTPGQNQTVGGGGSAAGNSRDTGAGLRADPNAKIDPRPNQLDKYSSYTYNIALYMLTPKNYVRMLKNPKSVTQQPKVLLMRNGGVGQDPQLGNEFKNTEFFIDDLEFKNIGPTSSRATGNTNAIDIKFTINEPNGVTLLERLKTQAISALEEDVSYIHAPYLLEIKFKGYDEFGKPSETTVLPKYIPIKFTNVTFEITTSGAYYKVKAVPYQHDIFNNIRSTIPINVQVSAGTVSDVLASNTQAFTTEEKVRESADQNGAVTKTKATVDVLGETSASLADAVTNHYKAQTKPSSYKDPKTGKIETQKASAEFADEWIFKVAPEILNAKLVGERIDALNTTQKTKEVYKQYGDAVRGKVNLTKDKKLFKINAGTNVINLINYIVVASNFVQDNLVDDLSAAISNKQPIKDKIKWFKVLPEITEFKGWDKKEGRYKWEITYNVVVRNEYYSDYPFAPKAQPEGKGIHKNYDYIFSGNNTQILDLKINVDTGFYTVAQLGTGNAESDKTPNSSSPQTKQVPQSREGQGITDDNTVKEKRAKDLMSSILHDGGDFLNINMNIVGDPDYLPTGDSFYQVQGNNGTFYGPFLPDGTINYDFSSPFFQLNFQTPTDYNDLSGFADPYENKKYGTEEFNGVFKVVTVSNSLSGGVFTQSINAVRTRVQPILGKLARNRESLVNSERREVAQTLQAQSQLLGFLKAANQLVGNTGLAKLTDTANSSITNITTNILPQIGNELEQTVNNVAPEVQSALTQVGNRMSNLFGTELEERQGTDTDILADEIIET
jgi:hypothetical protein